MDTYGIVIFSIVLLHLIAGFGYMAYKLSPGKKKNFAEEKKEIK
jgi:cbb3-type cytochrome oxidase subunit 3